MLSWLWSLISAWIFKKTKFESWLASLHITTITVNVLCDGPNWLHVSLLSIMLRTCIKYIKQLFKWFHRRKNVYKNVKNVKNDIHKNVCKRWIENVTKNIPLYAWHAYSPRGDWKQHQITAVIITDVNLI